MESRRCGVWLMDRVVFGAVALAVAAVYVHTLSPSIAGGDSGEIVAEGCQLGIAHPPGYPLITILIHFISKLSLIGSVAYRVNAMCSICTVIGSFFMARTVVMLSAEQGIAVVAPGGVLTMTLFAFSPLIWQYALTAEVFPLNTMLAAIIVYITVRFSQRPSRRLATVGAFVCGLALCNQHTIILYEAPLILWMLFLMRRTLLRDSRYLMQLFLAFVLGVSPYLYLPLSGLFNPRPGSWGDVSTLSGLLHHFLRRDYGTFQLFSGAAGKQTEGLWQRNAAYLTDLYHSQTLGVALALALVGVVTSVAVVAAHLPSSVPRSKAAGLAHKPPRKASKSSTSVRTHAIDAPSAAIELSLSCESGSGPFQRCINLEVTPIESAWTGTVLVATQVFYFCVFHSLSNLPLTDRLLFGVHQRFWMQPNVLLFIWVGLGFNAAGQRLARRLLAAEGTEMLLSVALGALALALGATQLVQAFPASNQRDARFFDQYAHAVLDPLPPNAILLINYDQQWTSVRYMQVCEGLRPDVTSLQLSMMTYRWFESKRPLYPQLTFPGSFLTYQASPLIASHGAFTLARFLAANTDKEVFLGGKLSYPDDEVSRAYDLEPLGLVSRFTPLTAVPNGTVYAHKATEAWRQVRQALPMLPASDKYPEETWEWTIGRDFKDRLTDSAAFVLLTSIPTANSDPRPLADAVYWLEAAIALEGGEDHAATSLLKNAGLGHLHMIQNKVLKDADPLPTPADLHGSLESVRWPSGSWSSERFMKLWGLFLVRPDAARDPQHSTIKAMHDKVAALARGTGGRKT